MDSCSYNPHAKTLDELLAGDEQSEGGVIILHGGPGTGKTAALRSLRTHWTASGSLYLAATGFHNEREIAGSTIEQLAQTPGIPDPLQGTLRQLMGRLTAPAASATARIRCLHGFVATLTGTARHARPVIVVDDMHNADRASRSSLLHIARRARDVGIVVVFSCTREFWESGVHSPGLLGLPDCRTVEASALSDPDVRLLLEGEVGAEAAAAFAGSAHRICGGNPRLVAGLLQDLRTDGVPPDASPVAVGGALRGAYRAALARHPALWDCALALAVLGDGGTSAQVARLLRRDVDEVAHQIGELNRAGFLRDGAFRHPGIRTAVLEGADRVERSFLHRRAVALLQGDGASLCTLAGHLIAADRVPDEVEVSILLSAARELLSRGQAEEARRCLRLADRAELDEQTRADVSTDLVDALWHVNPAAARQDAELLLAAMSAGLLKEHGLRLLILLLLWFGRHEEAEEAIRSLKKIPPSVQTEGRTRDLAFLVGYFRPELLDALPVSPVDQSRSGVAPAAQLGKTVPPPFGSTWIDITSGERSSLCSSPQDGEGIGACIRWGPTAPNLSRFWDRNVIYLLELLQHGHLLDTDRLCGELLIRLPAAESPGRQAFLTGLQSHVRMLQGDLRTAVRQGVAALELLPLHSWGVAIGAPLSALISAHTFLGETDEAARYLEYPVPYEMMQSYFGATYLMSRGHHFLATGRPDAALSDFTACSSLATRQRGTPLDLIGWRSSAAEAHLAMGAPQMARQLVTTELSLLSSRPSLPRGRALCTMAAVDEPERRRAWLEESVQVLRACGGRISLAGALADLSQFHMESGDTELARARWHEALRMTDECGLSRPMAEVAVSRPDRWSVSALRKGPADGESATETDGEVLSEAEWKVATLAAGGRSNRQIAAELYVTVSTVEQHLTRVYRKLSVKRRPDLSKVLGSFGLGTGQQHSFTGNIS
ncbi:AAA family ATPase [Streptomyces sp. NPDC087263]|uniref:helix-turn-helix transcriptional regulator n=1 Tax=Streptomyces sp. NPDC087263 TaxID=3365773 RepID=UPI0037F8FFC3